MPRRYRMTPARKRALRKAQLASARKRKGLSRKTKRRIVVGVGTAAVLGTAVGAYSLDRKRNTMMVYHATTHHKAKKIHKEGYKATKHRKVAYSNHSGTGPLHESGKVFIATNQKSIKGYGRAVVSSRVRKKKFYKYAKQDVHPRTLEGEKWGFKSRNESHYNMQVKDMSKAGVRLRYNRQARKVAGKRIRTRYEQGSYKSWTQ